MSYDSRPDTFEHIGFVQDQLAAAVYSLQKRARRHDRSKLKEPELSIFNQVTPSLKSSTYGSDEYKEFLVQMKSALDHHYARNPHHPEHFEHGIHGMSLLDLIEMLCDWIAATKRHDDGDIRRSIDINQERFGYGAEIKGLLLNTLEELERLSA